MKRQLAIDTLCGVPVTKSITCVKVLKALADETRWKLVHELLKNPATINELTEQLGATAYNVSKHIRILREAGIVVQTRHGKHVHCEVAASLRKQLAGKAKELDLGCCTFKFDKRCCG